MDLSVYISELLNEQGTVSIPQIGVFKQVRKRGYYNADEGKLYPPYYETEFEQQPVEDESLLQYLVAKSKVSGASARYFMDRYLHSILQQAEIGEVMLGRLGWLSKEQDTLNFRPVPNADTSTSPFGFTPVSVQPEPVTNTAEDHLPDDAPVVAEPQPAPALPPVNTPLFSVEKDALKAGNAIPEGPVTATSPLLRQSVKPTAQPAKPVVEQQPADVKPAAEPQPIAVANSTAETNKPFYAKPWFWGLAAAVLIATAVAVFYSKQNVSTRPAVAASDNTTTTTPSMDSVVVKTPVKADTGTEQHQTPVTPDTSVQKQALPASTEYAPEVETPVATGKNNTSVVLANPKGYNNVLMSGAFSNEAEAIKVVNRYKAVGINAGIVKDFNPTKYVKVGLGFYKTYAEGQAAKVRLVKLKHLRSSDLYVETKRNKKK
ncbi:hypothetical protein ABDD95_05860 [Mucilaginibacter sp. PAMB04274]|uniref:SPOR domain-containing protein n=1 Tax=Mucilaginibacter sp. PAMB04274 TaxID=3138568 RepID=UPI0031F6946E